MMQIALLRGINVGGNKMVAMAHVRDLAARLGLRDAKTLLQSGNLVFRSDKSAAQIEKLLEREIAGVDVFVRTAAEWRGGMGRDLLPAGAERGPGRAGVVGRESAAGG